MLGCFQSLETLDLRMERHCNNAMKLATESENCQRYRTNIVFEVSSCITIWQKTNEVWQALITFEILGGFDQVNKFTQFLEASLTSNLGDTRTDYKPLHNPRKCICRNKSVYL
jgi:O-succinylhomoserine sulfhydrylase